MESNAIREALDELESMDKLVIEFSVERNGETEFLMFNNGEMLYNPIYNSEEEGLYIS